MTVTPACKICTVVYSWMLLHRFLSWCIYMRKFCQILWKFVGWPGKGTLHCKITLVILKYIILIRWEPMISGKFTINYMKILCRKFEKKFSWVSAVSDLPALPPSKCFQVYIIGKVNHTVFLVQFQLFEKLTCSSEFQIEL